MQPKDATELKYIGKAVQRLKPEVLAELEPIIKKPVPALIHFQLLPAILTRFCSLQSTEEKQLVGIWQGQEANDLKKLFVAVILQLYNPDLLTGIHSEVVKPNLAREIALVLKMDRTWVSQRVNDIKTYLDPYSDKRKQAWDDFKKKVEEMVNVLDTEFKQQ